MKTFVFTCHSADDIAEMFSGKDIAEKENVLVQVFSGIKEKEPIIEIRDEIIRVLPRAKIIGGNVQKIVSGAGID